MNKIILFCFVVCVTNAFAQTDEIRNGNYWNQQSDIFKYTYILGAFDGADLGNGLSVLDFIMSGTDKSCLEKVKDIYKNNTNKYLSNVTNGQIVDGINEFYSDYRNRKITIINSVLLVLMSIAGESDEEMKVWIETYRKNAK